MAGWEGRRLREVSSRAGGDPLRIPAVTPE